MIDTRKCNNKREKLQRNFRFSRKSLGVCRSYCLTRDHSFESNKASKHNFAKDFRQWLLRYESFSFSNTHILIGLLCFLKQSYI